MIGDLNALRQGAQVVAAVAAILQSHPFASHVGEGCDHVGANGLIAVTVQRSLSALSVGPGLMPNRLETGDTLFQGCIIQIGHAGLDGVVEPIESLIGFSDSPVEFGKVLAAAFAALLATIKDAGKDSLQPLRLKQALLDVRGDQMVELVHRDRAARAAGLALPRFR